MIKNGYPKLFSTTSCSSILILHVLLFVLSTASKTNTNEKSYHNVDQIFARNERRRANNGKTFIDPKPPSISLSPKSKRVFNLPTVKDRSTAERRRNNAKRTEMTRRRQKKLTSTKNNKFRGRDFNKKPTKKKLRSGPSVAFSRQAVADGSEHYLDKSQFIQDFDKVRSSGKGSDKKANKRANIVLIMTDDLDVELGSLNYMPKLMRLLGEQGAMFSNSYTSTPMCCPSRSSMLTGMYIHNHEVYTNNQNCSSEKWQNTHERRSFAAYLSESGYKTGFFGKYLNRYNGSHIPAGWSEWAGLVGNSRYYNYSVMRNHRVVKYGNRYPQDYFPHVVTSDGLSFLRRHNTGDDPFLLVMSYPAPHGPEDSAPEHSHRFFNASDHHTASYNYAPNPDKQWILQWTDRMGAIEMKFTDLLMTKRLQTLQTIDDSITKIIYELARLKQLDNTYVFFTSDHGYHLGQFGLAKGKSMPFEFDIKVPFFVRGPGIKPGSILPQISLNIDLAPTFLDIAGVKAPAQMDGRSLLSVFGKSLSKADKIPWRDTFLVESSGRVREEEELLKKELRTYEREKALSMSLQPGSDKMAEIGENGVPLYTSKHERFQEVCKQEKFKTPCDETQKWFCVKNGDRWRLKKCRNKLSIWKKRCICQSQFGFGTFNKLDPNERRRQKKFIKRYVAKNRHGFNGKFIQSFDQLKLPLQVKKRHYKQHKRNSRRFIRSVDYILPSNSAINLNDLDSKSHNSTVFSQTALIHDSGDNDNASVGPLVEDLSEEDTVHAFVAEEELRDLENQIIDISDELRILENITVNLKKEESIKKESGGAIATDECRANGTICQVATKETIDMWTNSKRNLKDHIMRLTQQLSVIKNIYTHLQETQPIPELFPLESTDDDKDWQLKFNESKYSKKAYIPVESTFVLGEDTNLRKDFYRNTKKVYDPVAVEESLPTKSSKREFDLQNRAANRHRKTHLKKWSHNKPLKHRNNRVSDFDHEEMKLRPIPLNYLVSDFSKFSNEALSPVCWCDERVFMKLEMQKRRSQRRIERKKLKEERHRRRLSRRHKKNQKLQWCSLPNLHCFAHDNDHWRTPPLWNDGSFCFCISASNNTYWCLRTISEKRNFLYCEFITGLVTYYDLHIDPYQLRNVAFTLSNEQVLQLHSKLTRLRTCSGDSECHAADQFNKVYSDKLKNDNTEEIILPPETSLSEPKNEVFPTKSFTKKNRNNKIKKLRRKLRRRLKKERKLKKNKYAAMLSLPESLTSNNHDMRNLKKSKRKNKKKRHRHRKHRRKRKSKGNH